MPLPVIKFGEQLQLVENTTIQAAVPAHIPPEIQQTFSTALLAHKDVQALVANVQHRVLSMHPIDDLNKDTPAESPRQWVTTVYDYTNNRALHFRSEFPQPQAVAVEISNAQPPVSLTEFQAAVDVLKKDPRFARLFVSQQATVYRPMPDQSADQLPTGEVQRTVHVGLLPAKGSPTTHQIVGVNMITNQVITFAGNAPSNSMAAPGTCGVPAVTCGVANRGVAGQLWISWPAHNPVWRFLAIRPSASSGTRGSGIELRYVDYKGKRVLFQAHVPILNVLYEPGGCGSYRDWQWDEHCLHCDGADVAPGFRWAKTPPKTICEAGDDQGNFNGVAIFDSGSELLLTTVMEAGWYRYIMEWRFDLDGTIKPRFKFGATASSCVCHAHHHHCYWRFDFDLNGPANNLVEEFNNPPIIPNTNWHKKIYEIRRLRDFSRQRKWRVTNTATHEQYEIIPAAGDGVADAYGRGDLWVLRYHGAAEIDDGYNSTTGPGTAADIDKFVNGELVENKDVVVWYGAHFRHIVDPSHPEAGCEQLGPTLKLMHW
jgi:hypothetical protein